MDALGARVTGYALRPPTNPSLFEQAGVASSVQSIYADIRDFERLKAAVAECRPEVVIHVAAQSVVSRGYEDTIGTYSSNVMGTSHLLEALRQLKHSCAVRAKCYANREWVWGIGSPRPWGAWIDIRTRRDAPNS